MDAVSRFGRPRFPGAAAVLGAVLAVLDRAPLALAQAPHLVADILPGSQSSGPDHFVQLGTRVYFSASGPGHGLELWASDGSTAGTVEVADIVPGPGHSRPEPRITMNGVLFLTASEPSTGQELWRSDGTAIGATRVADINPGAADSTPDGFVVSNGQLFFTAIDGTGSPYQRKLWKTDGTPGGTVRMSDVAPAIPAGSYDGDPSHLTDALGTLFFLAKNDTELWKTDGTQAGTARLATFSLSTTICDPRPGGPCQSYRLTPGALIAFGGYLYFGAYSENGSTYQVDLWRSDGTPEGTVRVTTVYPVYFQFFYPPYAEGFSAELGLFPALGVLVFPGPDSTGRPIGALWRTDGTEAGTMRVVDVPVSDPLGGGPYNFAVANGIFYFVVSAPDGGAELWHSDGTAAGTERLRKLTPVPDIGESYIQWMTEADGRLYFQATEPDTGQEMWVSDGTVAGTHLFADIMPGPDGSHPYFRPFAGSAIIAAYTACSGLELWSTGPDAPAPTPTCGNGTVDPGEQCDLGEGNGRSDACCRCDCTFDQPTHNCRPFQGGCDRAEFCPGNSADCPPDATVSCGDGVLDPGEQCDEGASNGGFGTCCAACCTFEPPSRLCRYGDPCSPAQYCPGTSAECPPAVPPTDGDGDGVCDELDPCTSVAPVVVENPRLTVSHVDTPDDESLVIRARLTLPPAPPIDPATKGLRIIIADGTGFTLRDDVIPGGASWRTNAARTSWIWKGDRGFLAGVWTVKIRGNPATGALSVRVRAPDVALPVDPSTLPLRLTLVIDAPTAASGQCAEIRFTSAECLLLGTHLRCRGD